MTKYEKETMIAEKEWYLDDEGTARWAATNTHSKRANSWAERPNSAPLMTQERSAALNKIKTERRDIEFENALVRAAEAYTAGRIETVEEAQGIILEAVAKVAMSKGSAAHAKLAFQMTKALDQDKPAGGVHIHTPVVQIANVYDRETIDWAIDASPDHVRKLVSDADWTGAEDLKTYTMEELDGSDTD